MTASHPGSSDHSPDAATRKHALRAQLRSAREALSAAEVTAAAAAIGQHVLALEEVRRSACVAAYVSVDTEPGTLALLEALHAAGKRVLLPVTFRHQGGFLDLDWAAYAGPGSLAETRFGLLEPTGERLGVDAIADADLVLAPGTAVDAAGHRIGKGAGCYDRSLARAVGRSGGAAPVWVLLYDDEVERDVPVEPHDVPVTGAVTPSGVHRFTR